MYITNIEIRNIRCFQEIRIPVESNGKPCLWTTFLGDNGTGKTTLMRSIAMGLCDKADYSGLLQEIYGDWISKGPWMDGKKREATIRIVFITHDLQEKRFIETTIEEKKPGNFEFEQKTGPTDFPWQDIFVCGYGAGRRAFGSTDYPAYFSVDAFYTLFNYETRLQNPELILHRVKDYAGVNIEDVLNRVSDILMLEKNSVKLTMTGIEVKGPWGEFRPLGALGDGYQATLAWIVDMFGWAMFYDNQMIKSELTGIVLLDELEQHLHPKWQRQIISLLKKQFPKMQFISTTHSPLIAANAGKLSEDDPQARLFHLSYDSETGNKISEVEERLAELDLDQILSSEAFDYIPDPSSRAEAILREASILAGKGSDRTPEENERYEKVLAVIKQLKFPEGQSVIEREAERKHFEDLVEQSKKLRELLVRESYDKD
ncbi:MAG: AAA family ATPase [Nitrospirota bacterium]|nr:AAA family ATPase [Nitrospirota bacterium]